MPVKRDVQGGLVHCRAEVIPGLVATAALVLFALSCPVIDGAADSMTSWLRRTRLPGAVLALGDQFGSRNLPSDAKLSRMENGIQISDDELELLVTAVAFLRACLKEGLPKLESSGKYFHGVPDLADVTALYERLGNEARQRFLPISGQHIM